ncbi:MAG: 2-oxoacid:acceptor oxidoreductase family protein [Propionibacteriaceae bacterium]|nr:2-oxoacid:acceptor oxidoreductase family protein [Propionibacteriaceae bacterium]
MTAESPKYPGLPDVINGNGAVAYVMKHVCGGVIGYPITPSTEISEIFEAARAEGQLNVFGQHPFFVEAEGEHSAQSGALGAALTGGNYISNASSSQGILYGLESHYVTVGKKIGGFVLQVAARVVSKHSLNVMAGHDDIYALLPAGYTILFGSNPQEAADLAAIAYRVAADSLIPVANTFDGFATSHVMSELLLPEPELLREFLGHPAGRLPCPTVAQDILFGAKGRQFQLARWLDRHADDFDPADLAALKGHLASLGQAVEADDAGDLVGQTAAWLPEDLRSQWRRQWLGAWPQGTRQRVPALVDPHNPGLTGPVQNQPDFQAGAADHRTHFASAVPGFVAQAMREYADLTGRSYSPIQTYGCEDADCVMVGLGSITDDVRAVLPYLRSQGHKVGVISVKLLQPFPEAELAAALGQAKAVTVLERSDDTALTRLVNQALCRARSNADSPGAFPGLPALAALPRLTTAIFGLGGHDVQPRHLVAAFEHMRSKAGAPLIYLGSQFFSAHPTPTAAALQDRLRAAYPETEAMALATGENPDLLPPEALRIRFHSVGGYGTVATGKLLTDILSGVLGLHSKSAPKYGSEKSGAATNYYITLSPEPVLLTNAELEDVEVVVAPDHQVFHHANPLKGLAQGGVFILQSNRPPLEVWASLPRHARQAIRDKQIRFLVLDAFAVARRHAPTPELETRMMGIAFIGAVVGHVDRIAGGSSTAAVTEKVREEITKKFGRKGAAVVEGNMAVIHDAIEATCAVDYFDPAFLALDEAPAVSRRRTAALSAALCPAAATPRVSGLFDPGYYEDLAARPFREGTIAEAPVYPGAGLFMPVGTGAAKDKGIFRRTAPLFNPEACTACLECSFVCPDQAIPSAVHEIHDLLLAAIAAVPDIPEAQREALRGQVYPWSALIRQGYRDAVGDPCLADLAQEAAAALPEDRALARHLDAVTAQLRAYPVARTRPLFTALEKTAPGTGGLFAAVVDPWKCTGCLQCVEVCGPGALVETEQDEAVFDQLAVRFERFGKLPNTPARFTAEALKGGGLKQILLDRPTYYAMAGGHGACRGCGEVTATRLLTSLSRAVKEQRRRAHIRELEDLIGQLEAKRAEADEAQASRIGLTLAELERALFLYEGGPTGQGPAPTVIANSTGCSSVYASTMPFTPFLDPWVNSLFQDAQALAVGLWEGLAARLLPEVKALRLARLELADAYGPAAEDGLATLGWRGFTASELDLMPAVLTVSGDGAAYDIGFGALSRVLASGTPIKAVVLDTGSYSNTGGQASTSTFIGQDADLSRYGRAHHGKTEARKELALLAAFHPHVFAAATTTALHSHYLETALAVLGFDEGAALLQVYTACGTEQGVPENLSNARAQLAVDSRMAPVFVHDPRLGETLPERLSLDGNPDIDAPWTQTTIEHVDAEGRLQLLSGPLTPAEFALGEARFAKQFKRLKEDGPDLVPIADFVALDEADRVGRTPYVLATDASRRLIKVACSKAIVALVEERQRHWQMLRFLAGRDAAQLSAANRAELEQAKSEYAAAVAAREDSLDQIAEAMAKLATARSPGDPVVAAAVRAAVAPAAPASASTAAPAAAVPVAPAAPAASPAPAGDRLIWLDPADVPRCNDCGTCYQDLPRLFEKAVIVVDGKSKTVGRMREGVLDGLQATPELIAKCARVKAVCDAEIIQ